MQNAQEYIEDDGIMCLTNYRGIKKHFVNNISDDGKILDVIYFENADDAFNFGDVYFSRFTVGEDK